MSINWCTDDVAYEKMCVAVDIILKRKQLCNLKLNNILVEKVLQLYASGQKGKENKKGKKEIKEERNEKTLTQEKQSIKPQVCQADIKLIYVFNLFSDLLSLFTCSLEQ